MPTMFGLNQPLYPLAPDFFTVVSDADLAKRPDAKPGDVINDAGDLLSAHDGRAIPGGVVFVSADQAKAARTYGWDEHHTNNPSQDSGLVRICR